MITGMLAFRRPLQALEHGDAVEARHEDVEENYVARLFGKELECFAAIRGGPDP